ncbi:MAG: hypothetical protein ABI076_08790 [Acidobacteriaceae bacterium]
MTVEIFNDSANHNIYPVLFAGAPSATDTWMQACFQLTDDQLVANPYPRSTQYRMYINCCSNGENGIPPGGSVTITLPLYSPLVGAIDPKQSGQLVDWWQGGGINFYRSPASHTSPPKALQQHWNADQNGNEITPTNNPPTCSGGCKLSFFKTPVSIPNNDPQQLTEYTLGAQPINPDHTEPGQPTRIWVPNNVDYDVSYVNYVYMPAVMEPYGNPMIGYIGSPSRISDFNNAIANWYASPLGADWPLYKNSNGSVIQDKIPSSLEIFLNTAAFDNTNVFLPAPVNSTPIASMTKEWESCVNQNGGDAVCPLIRTVTALLNANYDNYQSVWKNDQSKWTKKWGCTGTPVKMSERLLLAHLYGWTPFVENCTNTAANQLYTTPGYSDPKKPLNYEIVKADFDQLQYWIQVLKGEYGKFDPYVALVHGPDYLNAPYTYAYSVDDAVGNMQTDGTGLIISVGGTQSLPNPDHATPNVNFPFGYSSSYAGGIHFAKYGRCTTTPDTPTVTYFTSFAVPEGIDDTPSSILNCTNSMLDSKGRVYVFKLKGLPSAFPKNPYPTTEERKTVNTQLIDCTGDTGQVLNWCHDVYPYQQINPTDPRAMVNFYVVMGAPPPLDALGAGAPPSHNDPTGGPNHHPKDPPVRKLHEIFRHDHDAFPFSDVRRVQTDFHESERNHRNGTN